MDTKKLRQKILDLAIHGKLVPQDSNDEPASVLLERIREEKECLIKEGKIKKSKKSVTSDTSHYENVPFEVPEGWCIVPLFEICHSCLGKMLDREKNQGSLKPYLRNVNVRWGCFNLDDLLEMPFTDEEDDRYSIEKGDIVVCEGGEPGRCAIWEEETSIKFQKALHRVRCYNGVSNSYIKTVLEWYALSSNIEKYYTGSTIKHLTGESLGTILIPLPPYSEQQRIVSQIEKVGTFIALLESNKNDIIASVQDAKNTILNLAIQGKLVTQDANDEPASELLKRLGIPSDNRPYENIPSSWSTTKVKELFIINPKNKVEDDVLAGFVPMTNVCDGFSNHFTYEERNWGEIKKGYVHFQDGDIAVAKISPCLENRKSVIFNDLPNGIGAGTTELNIFRTKGAVLPEYALCYFKSKMFIDGCAGTYNGVVGQQRVAKNYIAEKDFFVPPLDEQKRIFAKVKELFTVIDDIESSLQA